jgi:biotin carboxyl carrier protein
MSSHPGRRAYLLACVFALVLVLLPFLFWYDTWFGRRLTDIRIEEYLRDASAKPRRAQHALVQVGERLSRGDLSVRRWYPEVISLAASPAAELRQTAAWIMGQDPRYEPFHQPLRELLRDPSVMVRRNAALSLAAFRDPAARTELRAMLSSHTVESPGAGRLAYRLKPGDYVNPGTLVARLGALEVRSPVPGEVLSLSRAEGAAVSSGDALVEIAPDEKHAWEALRALYLVGEGADVNEVQRYARGVSGMPENLRRQAALTLGEIQARNR